MKYMKLVLAVSATLLVTFFLYAFTIHGLGPPAAIDCAVEELKVSQANGQSLLGTRCQYLKESN